MESLLTVVLILLGCAMLGFIALSCFLAWALSRIDDRKILGTALKDMVNVLVTEKEDNLSRQRIEAEVELGIEHIRGQTVVEAVRRRVEPVSNNGRDLRDSVHVDTDE